MKTIDIFRGSELFVTIKPDANSVQAKTIMAENELRITFDDSRRINFSINDYADVFGERYVLSKSAVVTKVSQFLYKYSLVMVSEGLTLAKAQFLFLGSDNSLKESDFSLMGDAKTFVDLLVQNANRIDTGWSKGEVIPTDFKNLTFNKENCFNALGRVAEAFGTEFWIQNKTINLVKVQSDTGKVFRHGRNKGLYEISRQSVDNSSLATRLYVFGSEKNLPSDYRGYSKRLLMTDGDRYVEKNTDKYGIIEYTEIFDDVYPTRTGKVTSVNAANPYEFIDTTMDFDLNAQLLPGLAAKVVFNTGQLAGYQFDIGGYDNGTKKFSILKNKNERVLDIPSMDLRPSIGDEYVLIDIVMPPSYVEAAEARLKEKATLFLDSVSEPQLKYQVVFDPVFLRRQNFIPQLGDLVWLIDDDLELQRKIRITSTTRGIVNEYDIKVELADQVSAGKIDIIINGQQSNERNISNLDRQVQNASVLNNTVIGDLKMKQGTLVFEDMPATNSPSGYAAVYINLSTGKLFKLQ